MRMALLSLIVMLTAPVFADGMAPVIPKGKGEQCVAETDFMRRNHMNVLLHQRDKSVFKGERSKRFSLQGCVECHAVPGPTAKPVTYKDPKHFCRSCHEFAAVKIDCFECHASRPDPDAKRSGLFHGAAAASNRVSWK
jgi:predicted CXXCH cytochrome family protein